MPIFSLPLLAWCKTSRDYSLYYAGIPTQPHSDGPFFFFLTRRERASESVVMF